MLNGSLGNSGFKAPGLGVGHPLLTVQMSFKCHSEVLPGLWFPNCMLAGYPYTVHGESSSCAHQMWQYNKVI